MPAGDQRMTATRIIGIILLLLGLAGFFTGGFSFTKDTTQAQLGPLKLQVQEQQSVNIPQWLSLGAVVLGGVLLVLSFKRK
jgi:hypothetical protein